MLKLFRKYLTNFVAPHRGLRTYDAYDDPSSRITLEDNQSVEVFTVLSNKLIHTASPQYYTDYLALVQVDDCIYRLPLHLSPDNDSVGGEPGIVLTAKSIADIVRSHCHYHHTSFNERMLLSAVDPRFETGDVVTFHDGFVPTRFMDGSHATFQFYLPEPVVAHLPTGDYEMQDCVVLVMDVNGNRTRRACESFRLKKY